jgi:hypothetical protein
MSDLATCLSSRVPTVRPDDLSNQIRDFREKGKLRTALKKSVCCTFSMQCACESCSAQIVCSDEFERRYERVSAVAAAAGIVQCVSSLGLGRPHGPQNSNSSGRYRKCDLILSMVICG